MAGQLRRLSPLNFADIHIQTVFDLFDESVHVTKTALCFQLDAAIRKVADVSAHFVLLRDLEDLIPESHALDVASEMNFAVEYFRFHLLECRINASFTRAVTSKNAAGRTRLQALLSNPRIYPEFHTSSLPNPIGHAQ